MTYISWSSDFDVYTVNSLLFARTLFSLIFVNLIAPEFNILAKCFRIYRVYLRKYNASRIKISAKKSQITKSRNKEHGK